MHNCYTRRGHGLLEPSPHILIHPVLIILRFLSNSSLTDQDDLKFGVERAEMLSRHLEETFQQAVDHRYAHEYGETTPATSLDTNPGTAAPSSAQKSVAPSSVSSSGVGVSSAKESNSSRTTPLEARAATKQKGVAPALVSSSGVGVLPVKGGSVTTPTTETVANQRRATSQVTEFNGSTGTGVNVKEINMQVTRSKQEPHGNGSREGQRSTDRGSRVDAKTVSKALQKELKNDGLEL